MPGSSTEAPRLLVADDQPDVLEAVRMLARANGFDVRTARSPAAVLAVCEAEDLDVCLLDLNYARDTTSGQEGLDLLARLRELDPALPVVVMTAWATIEGAVDAIRRGARDYIQKPWDNARLVATLRAQLELRQALRAANRLGAEAARAREHELPAVVASSRAMTAVMSLVERI
ncbi:MAG: response regulator, partial [Kofleriaceae bacterium]